MRLPRVRFTVNQVMVALVFVSLLIAIFNRYQRLKTMVVNQENTLLVAETNFLNATIARENVEDAFTSYLKIDKQRLETALNASSKDGDDGDRTLKVLRSDVVKTRAVRRGKRLFWEYERMALKKLRWELANSWRLWRRNNAALTDEFQRRWRLSDQEKPELDQRLRHFGHTVRD